MLYSVFLSEHELDQKNGGGQFDPPPPGNPRLAKTLVKEGLKGGCTRFEVEHVLCNLTPPLPGCWPIRGLPGGGQIDPPIFLVQFVL